MATFELTSFISGARLLPDATAASLFLANLHFIAIGTDYASLGSDPSALQHYWSLAVEEQFYLAWPLLVLVAVAVAGRVRTLTVRRVLVAVLAVIAVSSYLYSVSLTSQDGTAAFFSPLTRAWELALGCLVAVLERRLAPRRPTVAALLGWLGVVAIGWSVTCLSDATAFPGWIAAVPALGAAALIVAGNDDAGRSRLSPGAALSTAVPRYVGDISYSLYLVHWPVFTIAAARSGEELDTATRVVLIGAVLVCSAAMYHGFEDPIRRSRLLHRRPWLSLAIVPVGIGIVLAVAWFERYRWALETPLVERLL